MKSYDIAIIGAGIGGCTLAYFAKQENKKVLLIDRALNPATGGSGAAGAFISPKLGKKTPLLELTNLSFKFATKFYSTNFREFFDRSAIVRLPKDKDDAKNFKEYQKYIGGEIISSKNLKPLGINCKFDALFFKDGGVCDAQNLCKALIKDIDFLQLEVKDFNFNTEILINNKIQAKKVVLSNGYEGHKLLEYMGINGIWGSRGDFFCSSDIKVCMHKDISISANKEGIIKIGATHLRAKSPTNACMQCDGEPLAPLIKSAKEITNINNLKLKETFCGMRSGSKDYFPLVGKVIDSNFMLNKYPQIKKGFSKVEFKYINNLYVLNGFGGRGFVFAPLMAKWLINLIFKNQEVDLRVNPNRLFFKWARRLK